MAELRNNINCRGNSCRLIMSGMDTTTFVLLNLLSQYALIYGARFQFGILILRADIEQVGTVTGNSNPNNRLYT